MVMRDPRADEELFRESLEVDLEGAPGEENDSMAAKDPGSMTRLPSY